MGETPKTAQSAHAAARPIAVVSVDAVVFDNTPRGTTSILLIKRANDPFKGQWALPGGHVERDETLDTAVVRELQEETGLTGVKMTQFRTFGDPYRDPRGRFFTVVYVGVATNTEIMAGDDAAQAQWFPIHALPPLAFDHDKIIAEAIAWSPLQR